ncbi:MAG: PLDc N-terminal domain-containing protein [Blastocatellia bacterium]
MFSSLFSIAAIILDIFAISDVMNSSRDLATKIVLIALILLIPFVGAGLYLFAFRDKGYS